MEFKTENAVLKHKVLEICRVVTEAGGRPLLVGGCVRDLVMNLPAKDMDIEVYGLSMSDLERLLRDRFQANCVGESFAVVKIPDFPIDVSLPRRDNKSRKESTREGFSDISIEAATSRRDFTINALLLDPVTGDIFDPVNGLADLKSKKLRHISNSFGEDPLRVLRGMQFAARFDFDIVPETVKICSSLNAEGLPAERLLAEWKKLIINGKVPSKGLRFLRACGWVKYYPELEALIGCKQDAKWHPEGDVWDHTLHCMDAFAREITGNAAEDLIVGFAALCHDFGKPMTTELENGRLRSLNHEEAGEIPTRTFLNRLTEEEDFISQIIPLVTHHLRPLELYTQKAGDAAVRRLAKNVCRIDRLVRVARADRMGRPPAVLNGFPEGDWLLRKAKELAVDRNPPKPILMGRHLVDRGLNPGKQFKIILDECFEAQMEGKFSTLEEGLVYLDSFLKIMHSFQ